ncbi:MAG: nucleotidyltransferase domain-containing protein [Patescibacteria group bacterium]|jgi:predicted nucleotidyltransferase
MSEESSKEKIFEHKEVNEEKVEKYFIFKKLLFNAEDNETILKRCESADIDATDERDSLNTEGFKKDLLHRFWSLNFPESFLPEEQREKQDANIQKLVEYLRQQKAQSTLWVGGSYATGKARIESDLDLYFAVPKFSGEEQTESESNIFKKLDSIGFVISEKIAPFADSKPVMQSGKGLFRLSGVTKDGVGLDIHGLGIEDLRHMNKISSGFIKRVRQVEPYKNYRVSFGGNKKIIFNPGDKIFNYLRTDDEVFKGIYLDNFSALGQLVYDPMGEGEQIQDDTWLAIVKGFLFHSGAYQKNENGKTETIDQSKASFGNFLKTLHYQSPEDYSTDRLETIEDRYQSTLNKIAESYNLFFS